MEGTLYIIQRCNVYAWYDSTETAINMMDILLYIGTAQGAVLSFVLWTTKRGNAQANRLLGMVTGLVTVTIFAFLFRPKPLTDTIIFICIVVLHIYFLIYPFIFLYVVKLTDPGGKISLRHIIYFVPFFLVLAVYLFKYFLLINSDVCSPCSIPSADSFTELTDNIIYVAMLNAAVFLALSFLSIRRYQARIKNIFSSTQAINLQWLAVLLTACSFFLIIALFLQFLGNGYHVWGGTCFLFSVFIYYMGYKGLKQPEIFFGVYPSVLDNPSSNNRKYKKSTLTKDMCEQYLHRLMNVMDREKFYLNNELNLPKLASLLAISPNHLSQILNECLNKNFFDFINEYRIKEAKQMLSDKNYKDLNILAIGLEAGFNTNTTFISAFKRCENITPSEYRKMQKV